MPKYIIEYDYDQHEFYVMIPFKEDHSYLDDSVYAKPSPDMNWLYLVDVNLNRIAFKSIEMAAHTIKHWVIAYHEMRSDTQKEGKTNGTSKEKIT